MTQYTVTCGDRKRTYPEGTLYREVAADWQDEYANDILMVWREGKLCELTEALDRDCTLRMVTAADKAGIDTYERSAIFILLKAFYDVVGAEQIERVCVDFSVDHSLFVWSSGSYEKNDFGAPAQEILDRVEARMRELVELRLPIVKNVMRTEDAIRLFEERGMHDKAKLLYYRLNSRTNVYQLGDYCDFFYGYMVPDTGYIRQFAIKPYEMGFVLQLPEREDPTTLGDFTPPAKVFKTLCEATLRAERIGVGNVGSLNEKVASGLASEIILAEEALMEKRIGDIAEEIASRKGVRFVMIAGPSSSGKTTFSHRLSTQLRARGLKPHAIATDNYFKNRDETPRDENGEYDFECLEAMDVEQFNKDMTRLLAGETVELPQYNFKKGMREYNGNYLTLGAQDILVIEGIHCLNDKLSYSLPKESKYRIYISCLTTLNVDDHNRVHTTDARLLRRIVRDAATRGYGAQATIHMWGSVRRGEEKHIFPFQDSADVVFNSALAFETALLKTYAEPLLFAVPHDCDEYIEAKRLLKFLDYLLPIPAEPVPKASLLREFIGGGCYNV